MAYDDLFGDFDMQGWVTTADSLSNVSLDPMHQTYDPNYPELEDLGIPMFKESGQYTDEYFDFMNTGDREFYTIDAGTGDIHTPKQQHYDRLYSEHTDLLPRDIKDEWLKFDMNYSKYFGDRGGAGSPQDAYTRNLFTKKGFEFTPAKAFDFYLYGKPGIDAGASELINYPKEFDTWMQSLSPDPNRDMMNEMHNLDTPGEF